jgi:hypothetical protein
MLNSACGSPSQFVIDYSNGSGTALNESTLIENANIGRGADVGVYADWNSSIANDSTSYAFEINNTTTKTTLTDYNDWANLYLAFHRGISVESGISQTSSLPKSSVPLDPMSNDQQPLSDCTPDPLWMRLAMQPTR